MYKVTLSMPVYNVAKYVERALLSALNQTFESIEFLIVDDRGSDNSMDIIRKIIKNHPRGKDVRIIEHPHNIGTGATKNTAIDNAQGEYLFFMDSDDEITPDCIEILYNEMINNPVDFIASSSEVKILNNDKNYSLKGYKYLSFKNDKNGIIGYIFEKHINIIVTTWNKLYNINFLRNENIRCVPKHIIEDEIFTYNVCFKAKSFTLIPNITYIHYKLPESVTDKKSWSHEKIIFVVNQYIEILEFKINLLKNYKNENWYNIACQKLVYTSFYMVCFFLSLNFPNKKEIIIKTFNLAFSIYTPSYFNKVYLIWILHKLPYHIMLLVLKIYKMYR